MSSLAEHLRVASPPFSKSTSPLVLLVMKDFGSSTEDLRIHESLMQHAAVLHIILSSALCVCTTHLYMLLILIRCAAPSIPS